MSSPLCIYHHHHRIHFERRAIVSGRRHTHVVSANEYPSMGQRQMNRDTTISISHIHMIASLWCFGIKVGTTTKIAKFRNVPPWNRLFTFHPLVNFSRWRSIKCSTTWWSSLRKADTDTEWCSTAMLFTTSGGQFIYSEMGGFDVMLLWISWILRNCHLLRHRLGNSKTMSNAFRIKFHIYLENTIKRFGRSVTRPICLFVIFLLEFTQYSVDMTKCTYVSGASIKSVISSARFLVGRGEKKAKREKKRSGNGSFELWHGFRFKWRMWKELVDSVCCNSRVSLPLQSTADGLLPFSPLSRFIAVRSKTNSYLEAVGVGATSFDDENENKTLPKRTRRKLLALNYVRFESVECIV